MIQLSILSGKKAGTQWVARRFPVRVGRESSADLQLEEAGVWEQHLQIELEPREGFVLASNPHALSVVNGQPVQRTPLRNGDAIELGSIKLQFWLGEARQRGVRAREWFVWFCVAAVCLGQIWLIYWMLQ